MNISEWEVGDLCENIINSKKCYIINFHDGGDLRKIMVHYIDQETPCPENWGILKNLENIEKRKPEGKSEFHYHKDRSHIWPDTDEYTRKCYDKVMRPGFAGAWSAFWGGVPGLQ